MHVRKGVVFSAVILLSAVAPMETVTGLANGTAGLWQSKVGATNTVVSSSTAGGGYKQNFPVPGGCGLGTFNANHSESWLTVKPGTETLVGSSKFFFEKFSTFYNFHLGSYNISGTNPRATTNNIVQGYECVTTGTQEMPPSWTDTTDPNVDFDTH